MNLFGWFKGNNSEAVRNRARSERLQQYGRYLRAYQGYSIRGVLNTNVIQDWHRLKFNFNQPVVNLSAGWFAAKPLDFSVDGDPYATRECYAIWDRSGSDCALLENAILCGIYGDLVGLATQDDAGRSRMEFVDPSICEPIFDGADYSRLAGLEIAYETRASDGECIQVREMWGAERMDRYEGDKVVSSRTFERLPAAWIRNSSVKGLPYGLSDVEPIVELVEEYDHLASKQTRIVDYYASPNICFKGVQKGLSQSDKTVGTVFYLPADGDAFLLEWKGGGPNVEAQLSRIRDAIAEVSQVPAVAFGSVTGGGLTNLSGVAIKILYGPLLSKSHRKQASWGPSLEYLLWRCLVASGHKVELEQVNVLWPSATPVDGQAFVAEQSGKIAARVASRRTVMNDLGIEDPDAELRRIIIEEKMLQLAAVLPDLETDANRAAQLGARGRFVPEQVAERGSKVGDLTLTNDDDIANLVDRIDALAEVDRKLAEEQ
jgi:hypothetical protein